MPIVVISVDAVYTPVRKVHYTVRHTRVGQMTNYDRLVLDGWMEGKLNGVEAWSDGDNPPQISMNVNVGQAREDTTLNCPENSGPIVQHEYLWSLGISSRHGTEAWTIADWEYVGQSVLARRTYTGSVVVAGDTASEKTTFILRHTPE